MRRRQPKKVLPVANFRLNIYDLLLRHLLEHDPRLLIGPQIGEDATVIDAGDHHLVVTTEQSCEHDQAARKLYRRCTAEFGRSPRKRLKRFGVPDGI